MCLFWRIKRSQILCWSEEGSLVKDGNEVNLLDALSSSLLSAMAC